MIKCPVCKQSMRNINDNEYNGYQDAYYCESCGLEQAVHWSSGERIVMHVQREQSNSDLE
ncbi:MAG: hypothetical protein ACE3NC_07195 [Candidatus Wallacebacter cryptica]